MPPAFSPEVLESLDRVLGDLPDPARLIARDGNVLLRNEAARLQLPDGFGHLCAPSERGHNASCPECQVQEVLERGVFLRWHVVVPHEGPTGDYFEVTLNPVRDGAGEIIAVLELIRDVTMSLGLEQYLIGRSERQETEIRERSEESQRLAHTADSLKEELGTLKETQAEILYKDRLMALSQVVAGVAHEIHTPLGAMLSSADLLQRIIDRVHETLEPFDDETKQALVAKLEVLDSSASLMIEGARRIQSVVQSLRLFTRLDEAPRKSVDLHEGLESTLDLLHYRMGDRIRVERDYGELPELICRPDACNQVFMNLLVNAIQAIPGEGVIRVKTRHEEDCILIDFSDDGEGMDEEAQSRLFELGFSTKRGKGGAGIGLALSRRIVQEHGGTISVKSRPGKGTTFTVRLPLAPPPPG